MKAGCVLFDLDGTLLNTNKLVLESLKYTVNAHLGITPQDRDLYKYFGRPLVQIMADLDPAQAEQMVLTYREYSAERHDQLTEVFPQVAETLVELRKMGLPLAVVTSKLKSLALRGMSLFGLDELIDTCIAYEDTDKHKPCPDPIYRALEVVGLEGGRDVIMVGDSPYDLLCAANAGVSSAAVLWSLHPREVLESCKPDIWLPRFEDLLGYL